MKKLIKSGNDHTYSNGIRHPDTKTQTDKFILPPPPSGYLDALGMMSI